MRAGTCYAEWHVFSFFSADSSAVANYSRELAVYRKLWRINNKIYEIR